jgi:hypothetical protein
MGFRIADTFIDSLARLTDQEQKSVKTAVAVIPTSDQCASVETCG